MCFFIRLLSSQQSDPIAKASLDPRRMNVALTRAKCGLIVIGNSKTLEHDKSWAIWLTYMKKHNLISVIKACEPCK